MLRYKDNYDYLFKIVLIGNAGIGKSDIFLRYTKDNPPLPWENLSEICRYKTLQLNSGIILKAEIWDRMLHPFKLFSTEHYKEVVGALLVYDVTNGESFSCVNGWIREIRVRAEPGVVILLVGDKIDLCEKYPEMRKITSEEGVNLQRKMDYYLKKFQLAIV